MVRLQGAAGWVTFRDVLTVDKRTVGDREERLLKLLQSPEPNALTQARKIAQESARFNLGRITRTMNVPDIALEYLQPRHGAASGLKRCAMTRSRAGPSSSQILGGVRSQHCSRLEGRRSSRPRPRLGRARLRRDCSHELLVEDRASKGTCTVEFRIDPRLGIRVTDQDDRALQHDHRRNDRCRGQIQRLSKVHGLDRREAHQAPGPIAIPHPTGLRGYCRLKIQTL